MYTSIDGSNRYLSFTRNDQGAGTGRDTVQAGVFGAATSTSFTASVTGANLSYIAYCFTNKAGFNKTGSYTGNGSSQNIITGFEVGFVFIKCTSANHNWMMYDSTRGGNKYLEANNTNAEGSSASNLVNFYANGFGVTNSSSENQNGQTFIYLAFATEGSTATPSLANSFATELYTGNSGTKSITTGFKPDFSWIKTRSNVDGHFLFDTLRGVQESLQSNSTTAQFNRTSLTSFDSNGFTLGNYAGTNTNSYTYVSWNWKAGGIPSINTTGTIESLVSANQAAGFSIVKWTGDGSNSTIGHGLNVAPQIIFYKATTATQSWTVLTTLIDGSADGLYLNATDAKRNINVTGAIPTASVFGNVGYPGPMIGYCFTSIAGYSKMGYYNGTSATNVITTGFEPGFVMIKSTTLATAGSIWFMYDNKRNTSNPRDTILRANDSSIESNFGSPSPLDINFLANGFTINGTYNGINGTGESYIYLAIKEN